MKQPVFINRMDRLHWIFLLLKDNRCCRSFQFIRSVDYLHTTYKQELDSLLTPNFQTFKESQVMAG